MIEKRKRIKRKRITSTREYKKRLRGKVRDSKIEWARRGGKGKGGRRKIETKRL